VSINLFLWKMWFDSYEKSSTRYKAEIIPSLLWRISRHLSKSREQTVNNNPRHCRQLFIQFFFAQSILEPGLSEGKHGRDIEENFAIETVVKCTVPHLTRKTYKAFFLRLLSSRTDDSRWSLIQSDFLYESSNIRSRWVCADSRALTGRTFHSASGIIPWRG